MGKKAAVLFSGGKDSCYSAYVAKENGYELKCLITIFSDNIDSYMFHTPTITKTKEQAKVMNIPLLTHKSLVLQVSLQKYYLHFIRFYQQ